jgi:hypothetical protein
MYALQYLQGKARRRRQYASTARRCNAAMEVLLGALKLHRQDDHLQAVEVQAALDRQGGLVVQ